MTVIKQSMMAVPQPVSSKLDINAQAFLHHVRLFAQMASLIQAKLVILEPEALPAVSVVKFSQDILAQILIALQSAEICF